MQSHVARAALVTGLVELKIRAALRSSLAVDDTHDLELVGMGHLRTERDASEIPEAVAQLARPPSPCRTKFVVRTSRCSRSRDHCGSFVVVVRAWDRQ